MMLPDFRVRQRDYMLELSRALTQELDLEKLLGRVLQISIEMLAGQAGLIALRSEKGEWRVKVSHALPPAFLKVIEPFLADIPLSSDNPEDIELPEINRILLELTRMASMGLLTGVGLPLAARKKVVGVIFIFRGYASVFSRNDRVLLSSFADQAAIAVQNAQLYSQISHDKQRLDALLDSAADGILIISNDHSIERCNRAFARLIDLPVVDVQKMYHDNVIRWGKTPQGLTLEQAEAGGWPLTSNAQFYVEGDIKRFNKMPDLPVGISYSALISADGGLISVIATVRDITRYRQADELKSTFISVISHELKTPVALIKGYVSTLRREDATWDRSIVKDSLAVIEDEADRLAGLIENLLDASRLQAGGMKLNMADICIPDMAARLTNRFQIQTTLHQLVTNFPDNFPIIMGDEIRLEQVISNLISNSIKYAPQGEIIVGGQIKSDSIIICVTDQGPGIAPSDVPYVFDRFYRAPEVARKTKGAGLGLYLTRAIVEAHGGRIWVDTKIEVGGRICFSLPRQI